MKYYKLKHDLPTFKAGEIFYVTEAGGIRRESDNLAMYAPNTVSKFPNILRDWFEQIPEPVRDAKTKTAFMRYIGMHNNERFFQAVRNFAREYLGVDFSFIYASKSEQEYYKQHFDKFEDTFHMECDAIHELKREEDEASK